MKYNDIIKSFSLYCTTLLCAILTFAPLAFAQITVSTTRALNFGEAIVTNNDAVRTIEVATNNTFTADSEFAFVNNPVSGIYVVNSPSAFEPLTVMATVTSQPAFGANSLTIDNLTVDVPAQTDAGGQAIINLGGRIRTTGDGLFYAPSTTFSGDIRIDVTFP